MIPFAIYFLQNGYSLLIIFKKFGTKKHH